MENEINKIVSNIIENHNRIIDDWCKAYLSQLYSEGKEIKPGCFTLIENLPFFHIAKGIYVKEYWFEEGKPNHLDYNEWISVNDRLPEEGVMVLSYSKQNEFKLNYIVYGTELIWACTLEDEYNQVTHWMELPKPPSIVMNSDDPA